VRSDDYNANLAGRKVAYIPFNLANPRIATIDRQDHSAPCINECPGGVKPYGYITLARNGQYEEAMKLHLEDIPFPGSLGRACYAPCQNACTRASLEGAVDIRKTKRFFADWYYEKYPEAPAVEIKIRLTRKLPLSVPVQPELQPLIIGFERSYCNNFRGSAGCRRYVAFGFTGISRTKKRGGSRFEKYHRTRREN